jgi:SulP family sulfate permease
MVGYKLAKPSLFKQMYRLGWEQFIPFMATVVGILLTDLLKGIAIGLVFSIFYTLRHSYQNSHYMRDTQSTEDGQEVHHIVLAEEVSFFNKASISEVLNRIPQNSKVIIDFERSKAVAHDVLELIDDYKTNAETRNIQVEIRNLNTANRLVLEKS